MTELPVVSMSSSASQPVQTRSPQPLRMKQNQRIKKLIAALTGTIALSVTLWVDPAAADPFRTQNPRAVGDRTEAAFRALFEDGNYQQARTLLQRAESNEPLAYAMKASLNYIDRNWQEMGENARMTRQSAERLVQTDPLRGHIYIAAGHFLEGAHAISTQGTVAATPTVLGKLQQVFDELGKAERIAPTDPELNLLKGYMDLMLAVNLPFSDPNQAIERLQTYAAPQYLADRGIAIGYRDLRQEDQALEAVNRALQVTPNNPDLFYLKAQILVRQEKDRESLPFFRRALALASQLPISLVNQIAWEECRTIGRIRGRARNCDPLLRRTTLETAR